MSLKGIVFDFNGTLLWDSDKHEYAWKVLSERLRGYPFTEEEIRNKVHGRVNRVILEYLLNRRLDEKEAKELADQKEKIYLELCEKDTSFDLAPGAKDLLGYLCKHQIPHAIGSSSCGENIEYYIQKFHLSNWFQEDHIVHDDGTMNGKPAPDIYLRCSERLGILPKDLIAVEDAASGIRSASSAGYGRIIAVVPETDQDRFSDMQAVDEVIVTFDDFNRQELLLPE